MDDAQFQELLKALAVMGERTEQIRKKIARFVDVIYLLIILSVVYAILSALLSVR